MIAHERNSHKNIKIIDDAAVLEQKLLKCNECSYQSGFKAAMDKHMKDGRHLTQTVQMTRNRKRTPNINYNFKCDQCNVTIDCLIWEKHRLENHSDEGDSIMIACILCNFKTIHSYSLTMHMKNTHVDREENSYYRTGRFNYNFRCGECGDHVTCAYWEKHKEENHSDTPKLIERVCASCDFKTMQGNFLRHHMKEIHNIVVSKKKICKPNASSIVKSSESNSSQYDLNTFQCSACDDEVSSREWKMHLNKRHSSHLTGVKVKCIYCKFETPSIIYLREHIKAVHTLLKHQCTECDYTAKFASAISIHKRNKHSYLFKEVDTVIKHKL